MNINEKIKLIKFIDDTRYNKENLDIFDFETSYYCFDVSKYFTKSDGTYKFTSDEETAEKILLTHYLLYICDRGMDFRYVFKQGGYVISQLVETFLNGKNYKTTFEKHVDREKCAFKAIIKNDSQGEKIKQYLKSKGEIISDEGEILFTSRYIPVDIVSVFRTLQKLEEIGGFAKFLQKNYEKFSYLAKEMYKLTYKVKSPTKDVVCKKEIDNLIKEYESNRRFNKYSAKRIWCVLRDLLYHPYISECFKKIINVDFETYKQKQIPQLELPGDVWNNNMKFANCFWGEATEVLPKNMSQFVRKKLNPNTECSPINFDITFLFVPRMCNQDLCNICPFCNEHKKFDSVCHETAGKYCSFLLLSTGIKYCCPDNKAECKIRELMSNNKE